MNRTTARSPGGVPIVYYVSGHGYGHATRSAVVAAEILRRIPGTRIHFRTEAPAWLLGRGLPGPRIEVQRIATDVGVVQTDGLSFRLGPTLGALDALAAGLGALEERELSALARLRPALVLTDVSPFPLRWARRLGVPGVAVANFGWDEIYRGFARRVPAFAAHADLFAESYAEARLLLRLPMALPMAAFPVVKDVPLVVRHARVPAARVRRALRIGGRSMVFLSFGGFHVRDLPLRRLARLRRHVFVVAARGESPWDNVRFVDPEGLDHPSLVAAADLVIGKPGYGLVAEVTAHGRRMLYTSRGRFPEYPVLVRALRATGQARFCARARLGRGDLGDLVAACLALPDRPRRPPRTDGAEVVVEELLRVGAIPRVVS